MFGLTSKLRMTRSAEAELMDDPSVQGLELAQTLSEIEGLNQKLGAYAPSVGEVARLLEGGPRDFSLLDVGTGSGDVARRIVDWAATEDRRVDVCGIDLTETTIEHARIRCAGYPNIRIERQDLFEVPPNSYDVVHASQVLHHFPGASAARAVRAMRSVARVGVVINDLHRHLVPWAFIKAFTASTTGNPMIRYDAPLSVRRGFVREELEEIARAAGARDYAVRWWPLFRWSLVAR